MWPQSLGDRRAPCSLIWIIAADNVKPRIECRNAVSSVHLVEAFQLNIDILLHQMKPTLSDSGSHSLCMCSFCVYICVCVAQNINTDACVCLCKGGSVTACGTVCVLALIHVAGV